MISKRFVQLCNLKNLNVTTQLYVTDLKRPQKVISEMSMC